MKVSAGPGCQQNRTQPASSLRVRMAASTSVLRWLPLAWLPTVCLFSVAVLLPAPSFAEEGPLAGMFAWAEPHTHSAIDVPSAPIVTRYRTPLNRPRRLVLNSVGTVHVADWGAGTIVQIDAEGQSRFLADGLDEPAGLAFDQAENLYVVTHAGGMTRQARVIRIDPEGNQSVVAEGLTGLTDIVVDPAGDLYVASFEENRILRIATDGTVSTVIDDVAAPTALAMDKGGSLFVASSDDGTILRLGPGEALPVVFVRGLLVPSDIVFDARGHLIVASYGETGLMWIDSRGASNPFAIVPKGTIGIAFDREGNLLFANWDEHYLTRVVTHLSIPCPHCGKPVPLRLVPRTRKPSPPVEAESDEPVI